MGTERERREKKFGRAVKDTKLKGKGEQHSFSHFLKVLRQCLLSPLLEVH
jgi:hypothetical protein